MSRMYPSKYEQDEKNQIFVNRILYSPTVLVGLWDEDVALGKYKRRVLDYKTEHCQLLLQKTRKMLRNVLKATALNSKSSFVKYGDLCQVVTSDVTASRRNIAGNLRLAGIINEIEIDAVQHFRQGCILSASLIQKPCVRNTFKIVGDKQSGPVFYGEDVLFQIVESSGPPLYVQCRLQTTETLGRHLSLRLSETPDIFCRFRFIYWNPQKRYESSGTLEANTRVIIQHSASGQNLTVEPNRWISSFYGPECEVSCRINRDSHKMETAENFWKIVTNVE